MVAMGESASSGPGPSAKNAPDKAELQINIWRGYWSAGGRDWNGKHNPFGSLDQRGIL